MNIGVILIYSFILFKVLKKEQKMEMFILTGVTLLILNNTEGFTDEDISNKESERDNQNSGNVYDKAINPSNKDSNNVTNDGGKVVDNPIINEKNMGPYDGICLKTGNKEYWMKSPDNTSLVSNDTLYSYLGSQGPIKMRLSDQSALTGPPVDGVKGSDEKMFMFANNKTSLACCPSTFSTSTGCVCTTENQRDFVASRGVLPAYEGSNESNMEF